MTRVPLNVMFGTNVKDDDAFREFAEYCPAYTDRVGLRLRAMTMRKVMRTKHKRGPRGVRYQTIVVRTTDGQFRDWLKSIINENK